MTKQKNILILNGPNLNLLGTRQPEIYGSRTLKDLEEMCVSKGKACSMNIKFEQSNSESELVTFIQEAIKTSDGIIINAAAYSHTSVAILDALNSFTGYVIEVHISDISKREEFRKFSYVSLRADYVIMGKGLEGYIEALEKMMNANKQTISNAQNFTQPERPLTLEDVRSMMKDKRYFDPKERDESYVKKVDDAFARLYRG